MASRCTAVFRSLSRPSIFSYASRQSFRLLATATEQSSQSTTPPPPPTPADPKISRIVDDISGLTLLQAADLVTSLKEKPKEKTSFNVKLESFDAAAKAKVIREVKALVPNLTLIEAKKFVESLPQVLKENMPKEDAEKLKATLEGHGAVVKLE
ncbi:hypothetical protein AX14_001716 [Amanita brunnescens Koide BX004]|nr:hypothetical protein AX14_001716 [Amanita brunnescens Koide BX004]